VGGTGKKILLIMQLFTNFQFHIHHTEKILCFLEENNPEILMEMQVLESVICYQNSACHVC
jgi:hypothetical protein